MLEKLIQIITSENVINEIKENEDFIFEMIPELKRGKGFDQRNKWHIYDIYEHTLHVIENVPNEKNLRLAALFHDTGKPETFTLDEQGKGHFYNHWLKSKEIFSDFAKKYQIDDQTKQEVEKLILYHDKHLDKEDEETNKVINSFTKEELIKLYKLKKADALSQNPEYFYQIEKLKKEKDKILLQKDFNNDMILVREELDMLEEQQKKIASKKNEIYSTKVNTSKRLSSIRKKQRRR